MTDETPRERTAEGDGVEKHGIEAPPDGTEVELQGDGSGEALPPADPVSVTGALRMQLIDEDGNVIEERNVDNLVTTLGKNGIADQILAAPSLGKPTYMAVGTGTTAEALGDTALVAEAARVALTSKTRATNVITYVAAFGAGSGTGALTEAGIFTASSGGDLWNRVTFSVINKPSTASLTLTWTTTVG